MKDIVYYIGVDLGKQSSYLVVKDGYGKIHRKMKVDNSFTAIQQALSPFLDRPCCAVFEATCNYFWMYQQLRNLKCEVKLAHPLKTRAIASAKIKNDRLDATMLADLLRADLIPESYIPEENIRELREMTRQHIRLTQIRTKIKNQLHALLTKLNLRSTDNFSDIFGLKGKEWLRGQKLPDVFEFQKKQLLEQIEYYNHLLQQTDWKIEKMLRNFPLAQPLMQLPGIGKFGAAMLLAEIGNIHRFPSPKQLVGYAGVNPGLYESGQISHSRGITHQGNKFLRWILCEMAHRHIRKPGPLREFYLRLKISKGHGKALVATARKFLVQIYYVLKNNEGIKLDMPVSSTWSC